MVLASIQTGQSRIHQNRTNHPELDEKVESIAPEAEEMIFDMSKVSYISSAGLRSILNADELMEDKNGIKLINVNKDVKSILDMTNFSSMLNIE